MQTGHTAAFEVKQNGRT